MGYLNSAIISIDAILTRRGRELLSRADGSFRITQFALSDDEVDYSLYAPNHPSGSAFYGEAIENMPLLEAFADETQIMKYKLVTLPRGTSRLPVLNLGYAAISLKQGGSLSITPSTLNYLGSVSVFEPSGYVATVADYRLLSNFVGSGVDTSGLVIDDPSTTSGTKLSKTQVGTTFSLTATTINTLFGTTLTSLTTTLTVVGRDSGARITIPLTITKVN